MARATKILVRGRGGDLNSDLPALSIIPYPIPSLFLCCGCRLEGKPTQPTKNQKASTNLERLNYYLTQASPHFANLASPTSHNREAERNPTLVLPIHSPNKSSSSTAVSLELFSDTPSWPALRIWSKTFPRDLCPSQRSPNPLLPASAPVPVHPHSYLTTHLKTHLRDTSKVIATRTPS